jgi:hypothetical protein
MRQVFSHSEHLKVNAMEYPGTRQLCAKCGEPTGRCEDDSIFIEDEGPLCEACYAERKKDERR